MCFLANYCQIVLTISRQTVILEIDRRCEILGNIGIHDDADQIFLENLYNDYFGIMYITSYKIVEDDGIARDLVHDSILKLIDKIDLLREFECCILASYVVSTVRNTTLNYIKKRNRASGNTFFGLDDDISDSITDSAPYTIDQIIKKETNGSLVAAINELPEKQRDLLISKYFLGKSDDEIGSDMGINPKNIRTYIMRARNKAKEILTKGGFIDGEPQIGGK